MTVIAYKDGIIACDSMVEKNDCYVGNVKKIYEIDNFFVGCVGNLNFVQEFIKFLQSKNFNDEFLKKETSFEALVIDKITGKVNVYTNSLYPAVFDSETAAIGSGCEFALGAMHNGASAVEAVDAAKAFCITCGGKTHSIRIKGSRGYPRKK